MRQELELPLLQTLGWISALQLPPGQIRAGIVHPLLIRSKWLCLLCGLFSGGFTGLRAAGAQGTSSSATTLKSRLYEAEGVSSCVPRGITELRTQHRT